MQEKKEELVLVNFRAFKRQKDLIKKLVEKYGGEGRAWRAVIEKGLKSEIISKPKKK